MDGMTSLNMISTGIKTAAMLFIVLGLLILVLYFMKRFLINKKDIKGDFAIRVLSSLHLSTKERIAVVEIRGERIVLGIAPGSINYLMRLKKAKGEVGRIDEN